MKPKKLTRNDRRKIRYNIYRKLGYSVEEAKQLRDTGYLNIDDLKVKDGRVVKGRAYRSVIRTAEIDSTINYLRKDYNASNTVFTPHGYLLSQKRTKGRYNKVIQTIKKNDNLTDDQAYYFAYFMINEGYSYEFTRNQLRNDPNFEMYKSKRRFNFSKGRTKSMNFIKRS